MPTYVTPTPRPRSRALLRVTSNPYNAYDHEGRLAGAVRYDPEHGRRGEIHFVDAILTTTLLEQRTQEVTRGGIDYREPLRNPDPATARTQPFVVGEADLRDHTVQHLLAGESLPHTDYHMQQIRDGALLPIDEATHRLAFGVGKNKPAFVPVNEALAAARTALVARWEAEYPEVDVPEWPELTHTPPVPPGGAPAPVVSKASPAAPPSPAPAEEAPVPPALPANPTTASSAEGG
jgi:hypothetical protein